MNPALLSALTLLFAADVRLADQAMEGNLEAVRSLLSQNADVNAAQGDGMTALHWAANREDLDMTTLLLAARANPEAETRVGSITPLILAARTGSAPVIAALLKAGADPATSTRGRRPTGRPR
jgi:ankyrin repeat protein